MGWRGTIAIALLGAAAALPVLGQDTVDPKRIDELIAHLHSGKPVQRYRAAIALEKIGARGSRAIDALILTLDHPIKDIRYRASAALAQMGPQALPPLRAALDHPVPHRRELAARSIAGIGTAAAPAVPDLINALADADGYVRGEAAHALSEIGPAAKPAVPHLLRAAFSVHDQRSGRYNMGYHWISKALSVLATEDELVAALDHTNPRVRECAARAIGMVKAPQPKGVRGLIEAAEDPDPVVREAALQSLGNAFPATEESVPVLVDALQDGDGWAAGWSLQKVGARLRGQGVVLAWVIPQVYWPQLLLLAVLVVAWIVGVPFKLGPLKSGKLDWILRFLLLYVPPLLACIGFHQFVLSRYWVHGFLPESPVGVIDTDAMAGLSVAFCLFLFCVWAMTRAKRVEPSKEAEPTSAGDGAAPAP